MAVLVLLGFGAVLMLIGSLLDKIDLPDEYTKTN
jgi:hypothetical protein